MMNLFERLWFYSNTRAYAQGAVVFFKAYSFLPIPHSISEMKMIFNVFHQLGWRSGKDISKIVVVWGDFEAFESSISEARLEAYKHQFLFDAGEMHIRMSKMGFVQQGMLEWVLKDDPTSTHSTFGWKTRYVLPTLCGLK